MLTHGGLPVQALPGGLETDFIMVSCAGAAPTPASAADEEEEEGSPSPANGVSGAQALSLKRCAEGTWVCSADRGVLLRE